MQKKIVRIDKMMGHHLKVTFEDGTSDVLQRGVHLERSGSVANTGTHESDPVVGALWGTPDPVPVQESADPPAAA